MRNASLVAVVWMIVLGVVLVGFWDGRWTGGDVKKMASAAQKRASQLKRNAKAAVQSVTE